MTKRRMADLAFMAFLAGVAAYVGLTAQSWPFGARLFPTVIAGLMGALLLAEAARSVATARRGHTEEAPIWPGVEPKVAAGRAAVTAASIVGMALMVWALGFPIGGPLALAIHLLLVVRERLVVSLSIVVAFVGVLWAFSNLLNIPFPEPIVPGLSNPF